MLDCTDVPGDETHAHRHPASVMVTLTGFDRRPVADGRELDVALPGGTAVWLPAQRHSGRDTGSTPTHTILVELLDVPVEDPDPTVLGPGPRQG